MKLVPLKFATIIFIGLFGLLGCLSSEGQAESSQSAPANATEFVEGKHYQEIFPEMNTSVEEGKVEVIELFWLGCPHCYQLEPTIKSYIASKPDYVEFKQVPAALNPAWSFHAKVFYTAKILDPNDEKDLVGKLFEEMHEKNNTLSTPEAVKAFFEKQGYSASQFNNAFNSMALNAAMSNAKTISQGSQASSVPTIIVNGKYATSPYMAGGEDKLLKIVNMLTEKEKK